MSRKFRLLLIFSIITLIFLPIYSEAVKIATWNILNFPGTTGTSREDDFRKVIDQLDLDILVVQEMLSQDGVNQFLDNILNYSSPGIYEAARFINGPDSDNALFYKKSSIGFISHHQISTLLRDISEYWLEIKEGPAAGTAFGIYSVHLKAGTGTDNKAQREEEATILRNYMNDLPSNSLFLVCGDFNMRSSSESAFEILIETQADNDGRTKDPINKLGYWHDNEEFAEIHTQSTRTTQFGGGASGGLDDRFDLILISYELETSERLIYEEGSYLAYGNDGNHLNMAVNEGINLVVSSEIADALHEASDHLPVIIELESPDAVAISGSVKMENDETVQGVTVTFSGGGGTAMTDLDGYYDYSVTSGWTGTASPSKTGYTFSPDYRFYDNITSDQVDQDYVATLLSYTLSTFAYPSGGGTIIRDPDKISYDHGEDVNLTANSSAGYTFNEWSGDVPQGHEEDNPITIIMDSDKSITANFIREYTLAISTSTGGTTNPPPGSYIYDPGTEVNITALPESGYRFNGWTGDAPQGHENDNPITITMDSDESITANFIRQYTLTIAVGNGGITNPSPGTYTHDTGTEVSITATPNSGYEFSGWSGDTSGISNPITINMDSDKSITADFSPIQCMLTIAAGSGGTTNPTPGSHTYDSGTQVSVTARPNSGYEFSGWSVDASGTSNPITITMDSDKSITANFSAITEETGKKGGCFIATATYGSPLHSYVKILRDFRDTYLMPHKLGLELVDLYYKYSPFVAKLIARNRALRVVVRINLLPLVAFSYSMIHFGPIITTVMLILIFVLPIFSIWFFRRRLRRLEAKSPKALASLD